MRKAIWIDLICSLLLLLFLYTAISKLMNVHSFESVLRRSPLLAGAANLIAWGLPVAELILSILLFFPATRPVGLVISLVMLLVFTFYIMYMLFYTPFLPCSCGGVLKQLSWKQHLLFNGVFILLSAIGIVLTRPNRTIKKLDVSLKSLPIHQ